MIQLPRFEAKSATQKSDVDVVFVVQDTGKKPIPPRGPYAGWVEKFRKGESFTGRAGQVSVVPFGGKGGAANVAFVGLGPVGEVTIEKVRQSGAYALSRLNADKFDSAQVLIDSLLEIKGIEKDGVTAENLIHAFAEGFAMSSYKFDKYRKNSKDEIVGPKRVLFFSKNKEVKSVLTSAIADALVVAECMSVTRDWSNEPSNYGTPEYYAKESQRIAKAYGIGCKILTEAEARREKMGLFLSVSEGSDREARMVVLDYHPKGSSKTIALVGKGVTFDSGGISIKPSMKMEDMKHDMTGAATMMGAILLAARRKVKNRVIAILAFTENMPSGNATQPGNVIYGRAGKSVEIINTDAEGRLVLADALDYAHDFKPDVIVDAATLTGACGVALGKHCAALLSNDPALAAQIHGIAMENFERVWELPMYDEYFEDLKSDVADMKNSANDPMGGTIRGGIFLKQFIRKDMPWAHLDIAYTANNMGQLPYFPKRGASGMHVRTLAQFAADY